MFFHLSGPRRASVFNLLARDGASTSVPRVPRWRRQHSFPFRPSDFSLRRGSAALATPDDESVTPKQDQGRETNRTGAMESMRARGTMIEIDLVRSSVNVYVHSEK